jgi:NADH-quinone oxidoreductase subunit N
MNPLDFTAIQPLVALLVLALTVTLLDLWVPPQRKIITYYLTQVSLLVVAILLFMQMDSNPSAPSIYAWDGLVVVDSLSCLMGIFACAAVFVTQCYSKHYLESRDIFKGEFFTLSLFCLLGILIMATAKHFLVIFLGLELMSLSLYALTALRRDHATSTEAAMKYFVLGALSTGFLLYGFSMLYGATGSLEIPKVFAAIHAGTLNKAVLIFGLVFVVVGLAFKLGAVPFHMWVPDVYHGAPTPVTLLIAAAPKLGTFIITYRLLIEGLSTLAYDWQQMLMVLAVGSMLLGNLAAIAQSNLKRMLAYSTIGQVGFMLLGFLPTEVSNNTMSAANGYASSLFYIVTYVMTTLGTFGMILLLSRKGFEADHIDDFKGLAKRSPVMAGVMTLFMLSLTGIPPTVGFYAKLAVLQGLISTNVTLYIGLAVIAVVLSLIGAYYYLRIIKVMFFDEPQPSLEIQAPLDMRTVLVANGAAVLVLGILPGGLLTLCSNVILQALGS